MPIYDAAMRYKKEGVPLVVFGGKEYGMGSSRDWAAKGTALLGIKAVIVESFERIHRSNLVGMGVLPLTFKDGATRHSLGITGDEVIDIVGLQELRAGMDLQMRIHRASGQVDDGAAEVPRRYRRRGRILPQRRHPALRAAGDGPRRLILPREPRGPAAVAACSGVGAETAGAFGHLPDPADAICRLPVSLDLRAVSLPRACAALSAAARRAQRMAAASRRWPRPALGRAAHLPLRRRRADPPPVPGAVSLPAARHVRHLRLQPCCARPASCRRRLAARVWIFCASSPAPGARRAMQVGNLLTVVASWRSTAARISHAAAVLGGVVRWPAACGRCC